LTISIGCSNPSSTDSEPPPTPFAAGDADLEGIVAKDLADAYNPKLARWHKVLNRGYS
jgi:hypothetical protein